LLRRSYAGEKIALAGDVFPAEGSAPEGELSAGELLAKLQPSFRSALTLTKIYGYSLAEAAERSGISESAMKSRVSRAVRAAETLLNEERNAE
jgi:RNA polymerase sigma-70 factor (ECF subfamily)